VCPFTPLRSCKARGYLRFGAKTESADGVLVGALWGSLRLQAARRATGSLVRFRDPTSTGDASQTRSGPRALQGGEKALRSCGPPNSLGLAPG
jgi:hypothetical protein